MPLLILLTIAILILFSWGQYMCCAVWKKLWTLPVAAAAAMGGIEWYFYQTAVGWDRLGWGVILLASGLPALVGTAVGFLLWGVPVLVKWMKKEGD